MDARASRDARSYEDCEREAIQIEAQFTASQLNDAAERQWQAGRRKQQGVLGRGSPLMAERQRNSGGNAK